jgi:hypothetical protein
MDTETLLKFLFNMTRGRKSHVDVLPADALDSLDIRKHREVFLIVNSKPSNHSGEHWTALYLSPRRPGTAQNLGRISYNHRLEFFCSYSMGINYFGEHFMNFARRFPTTENTIPLQSKGSAVCGEYALWFLYNRMKGCCPMATYCKFGVQNKINDSRVRRFVKLKKHLFEGKLRIDRINQCCINF